MSRPPPPDTHEADDQQAAYDLGYSDGVASERERWQAVIEGLHDKVIPEAIAAERERLIAFIRKYCDDIDATGDWPPAYVADQLIAAIRKGE